VFWVISVYFNIRNTFPKSGTFLLGHPVYDMSKLILFSNDTSKTVTNSTPYKFKKIFTMSLLKLKVAFKVIHFH